MSDQPRLAITSKFGTIDHGELIDMDCTRAECYYRRTLTSGPVRIYLRDAAGVKGYVDVVKPGDKLFEPGEWIGLDLSQPTIQVTSHRYPLPATTQGAIA